MTGLDAVKGPVSPLALSQGDPAGIGPDIALMAWTRRTESGVPAFLYLGDKTALAARALALGLNAPLEDATPETASAVFPRALPVLDIPAARGVAPGEPDSSNSAIAGQPDGAHAPHIIDWIKTGVDLCRSGQGRALITAPIAKSVLYATGFKFPGHTEYLADLAADADGKAPLPVMMIASPLLRTVPVTIHIPLIRIAEDLTEELIVEPWSPWGTSPMRL